MQLSDAIMAGSKLRPQAFGAYFKDSKSCAFGAALEAIGIGYCESLRNIDLGMRFDGDILCLSVCCPKCDLSDRLTYTIFHLNDFHRAGRNFIAFWVREIEDRMEAGVGG